MEDILGKVKEYAVRAKDEGAKIGKQVYQKTNTVIGKAKISFAINETEGKIKDVYAEIGKCVYERYINGAEVCDFAKEYCNRIDALMKEKEELKENLSELGDNIRCSECGKGNSAEAMYCASCGAKLTKTRKNGNIQFEDEPIAVYSDCDADDAAVVEVSDDISEDRVVTIE